VTRPAREVTRGPFFSAESPKRLGGFLQKPQIVYTICVIFAMNMYFLCNNSVYSLGGFCGNTL
jgi:hypothetical protein